MDDEGGEERMMYGFEREEEEHETKVEEKRLYVYVGKKIQTDK